MTKLLISVIVQGFQGTLLKKIHGFLGSRVWEGITVTELPNEKILVHGYQQYRERSGAAGCCLQLLYTAVGCLLKLKNNKHGEARLNEILSSH